MFFFILVSHIVGSTDPSSTSSTSSSPITTLESVLATTFQQNFFQNDSFHQTVYQSAMNFTFNRFQMNSIVSSASSKRFPSKSLLQYSNIKNVHEEQSNSVDYENTYLCSEETSRFDDILSLTSITSNIIRDFSRAQQETNYQQSDSDAEKSDIDDTYDALTSAVQTFDDQPSMNIDLTLP